MLMMIRATMKILKVDNKMMTMIAQAAKIRREASKAKVNRRNRRKKRSQSKTVAMIR
jgi:hypothetical protein